MKLCVIVSRGLGAAHTGPYGNRWIDTPALNALAAEGVVFDVHLATHPDADSARRVWRTGCHVFPLPGDVSAPEIERPDLLTALRQAGVSTRLIVDTSRPSVASFESGWDEVRRVEDRAALVEEGRRALADLAASSGSGLVWLELASLLPPWEVADEFIDPYFAPPPAEEDEELDEMDEAEEEEEPIEPIFDPPTGAIDPEDDDLYLAIQTTWAAALSQQDAVLAELLDGLPDDVAVLFTSDHGQALGEHGVVGRVHACLHFEVVQVPLILRLPGAVTRRRVAELTLSIDLAPTVADLLGTWLPGAQGRSVVPLTGLDKVPWREYACLGTRLGDEIEWGLWTADRSLLVPIAGSTRSPRLYVKPDDRCEVNDVLHHHLEEAETLERTLRAHVETSTRPA
jgi:arylsulfatase A-like enzyme